MAGGAGAAEILNMWYDANIDIQMHRTAPRPIPLGRVSPDAALHFGMWLAAGSVFCFAMFINYLGAALLAFTIFFYVAIYTIWLKRRTPQNIVIGGAAGALPPVIGWVASGNSLTLEPMLYFMIIFLWTPPHFWSLALLKSDDYAQANIPMLPNVIGERGTKIQIFIYTILMVIAGFAPFYFGMSGIIYGVGIGFLSTVFLALTLWLVFGNTMRRAAGWVFGWSIIWLFLVFLLLPLDRFFGGGG